MVLGKEERFSELKAIISKEKKIAGEISSLNEAMKKSDSETGKSINVQTESLKQILKNTNEKLAGSAESIVLNRLLNEKRTEMKKEIPAKVSKTSSSKIFGIFRKSPFSELEKKAIARTGENNKKIIHKKEKSPRRYLKMSNRFFSDISAQLAKKSAFRNLKRDLVRANLQMIPEASISVILFTTLLSAIAGFLVFAFFLFFNLGLELPIITFVKESLGIRLLKVLWIIFLVPLGTFFIMFSYPSLEKKSNENKINAEIPFATIHMSAISGSLADPTKIFSIIISTNEYPAISREFTKLLNQINLYGYDLVNSLRDLSFNTASSKLSELLNGLSTTITSGGDISNFFSKRAESLMFDYKIDKEKRTKSAETFMDIYISVVIAAPMILMLLLMMMKVSGLGISLSPSAISLVIVLGVTMINIGFLTFLHLKQPAE